MGDESYPVRVRRVLTALHRVRLDAQHAYVLDGEDVSSIVYALVDDEGFARFDSLGGLHRTADGDAHLGRSPALAVVFHDPEVAA